GHWRFTMHGPDGADYPNHVTYREVEPDRRLVYVHGEAGDPDPSFTGVVTFEEMAGKTVLSLRLVFDSAQDRDLVAEKYQSVEGGEQTLGRLAALLAA
ncbi:MAG: SRPBCC domain-containing protein, partial [Actinomycetota bacterium]|nr:SRPBCC domain-containing protein [Actinomycetota bacterium]